MINKKRPFVLGSGFGVKGAGFGLGGGGYVLPTPLLLEPFDSITGFGIGSAFGSSSIKTDRKLQGTGSFFGEGKGISTGTTMLAAKTLPAPVDPSTLGVIAYAVRRTNEDSTNQITMNFGRSGTYVGSPRSYSGSPAGWCWESVHVSEIASLPTGVAPTEIQVRGSQNAPYNSKVQVDCLMGNAKGRPTVVWGFDDGAKTTYDVAYPYMKARGMVGTLYLNWQGIGDNPGSRIGNNLVVTEILEMVANGWAACLDGTRDDRIMVNNAGGPAACVTELNEGRAWLISKGLPASGGDFFCYPNGYYQDDGTGTGTPAAFIKVATATTDGGTTITFDAPANVANGSMIYGFGVPDGTFVASGGGTGVSSVVASTPLAARAVAMAFRDLTSAFAFPKLPDALAAAGFKSGRSTRQGTMYTRYGFGDEALFSVAKSTSGSAGTLAQMQPVFDRCLLNGETVEPYVHQITNVGGGVNWLDTDAYASFNYLAPFIASGAMDSLTKPQWYARDVNGLATLPF